MAQSIPVDVEHATKRQLLVAVVIGQQKLAARMSKLEERMTELDDATQKLTDTVDVVVALLPQIAALQAQIATLTAALEAAGLDDQAAADALADLQENLTGITAQTDRLAVAAGVTEEPPVEPPGPVN